MRGRAMRAPDSAGVAEALATLWSRQPARPSLSWQICTAALRPIRDPFVEMCDHDDDLWKEVLCRQGKIGLEHLPGNFLPNPTPSPELGDPIPIDKLEEVHIRRVLARSKSLDEAARVLGMDPATLWRRRKKYGI